MGSSLTAPSQKMISSGISQLAPPYGGGTAQVLSPASLLLVVIDWHIHGSNLSNAYEITDSVPDKDTVVNKKGAADFSAAPFPMKILTLPGPFSVVQSGGETAPWADWAHPESEAGRSR